MENVVLEVVDAMRPLTVAPGDPRSALSAFSRAETRRFNTPNPANIDWLVEKTVGLAGLSSHWHWQSCTVQQARDNLEYLIKLRHEAAHGVVPRPVVQNKMAEWAPLFVARVARCTDEAIKQYAGTALGLVLPWWVLALGSTLSIDSATSGGVDGVPR
ncbi:hypothetical protein WMF30_35855 [Sorangium sp. So ce134]